MTITEFLLARITEDEAKSSLILEQSVDTSSGVPQIRYQSIRDRVLAQCAAMRAVVELHEVYGYKRGSCGTCTDSDYLGLVDEGPCPTLRALASVYADHPDYNEACSLLDGWEWDR